MDRVFLCIEADPLARGHAWRAIKLAIGSELPVRWARHASHEEILTMLARAVALTRHPKVHAPL